MNNIPLYTIIFEDNTKFIGGTNVFDTKWLEIPCNQKIRRIFYRLPTGDYLTLGGYDKYFHMVDAPMDVMGKSRNLGKLIVEYIYIMGRKGDVVTSYRIALTQSEKSIYKIGDVTRRTFDINDKFITGLNYNSWR